MLARTAVAASLLALVTGVAACGDDDAATTGGAAGSFSPMTEDTLTVATSFPAAGFWEGQDVDHVDGGFEFELAEALTEQLGLDHLKVVDVPFDRIVSGRADDFDLALAQISVTSARRKDVEFSISYLETPVGVLTRPDRDIPDLKTAREQRWGVVEATIEVDVLDDLVIPDRDPKVYDTTPDALAGLIAGQVDAVALDYIGALAEEQADGRLELAAQISAPQTYAAALPKGSSNLGAVDSALRALVADRTLRHLQEDLYDRYDVDINDVPTIRVTPR